MNQAFFSLILSILFCVSVTAHASEQEMIKLSPAETSFLEKNPVITLGIDRSWEPYVIKEKGLAIRGFNVDLFSLINKVSGANFVLKLGEWEAIQASAINKEIDGLALSVETTERADHFSFSTPYLSFHNIIFTRKTSALRFNKLADFEGLTFAVQKGNHNTKKVLSLIKNSKTIEFKSAKEVVHAVTTGKADALIANSSFAYFLEKRQNPFLVPAFYIEGEPQQLVYSIRKDAPEITSILNKSLALIGKEKRKKLFNKWIFTRFPTPTNMKKNKAHFTKEEQAYLNEKKHLTVCIDPNRMPLEEFKNGEFTGLTADFTALFEERLGIPIKVKETTSWAQSLQLFDLDKCDYLSLIYETKERQKKFLFTKKIVDAPIAMVSLVNFPFVTNFDRLAGKKIGIVTSYALEKFIKDTHPDIEIVRVKTAEIGLNAVLAGSLIGFIDVVPILTYQIQKNYLGKLTISAKFDNDSKLASAVSRNNPLLLSILNKAIDSISNDQSQSIVYKYLSVVYEKGLNKTFIIRSIAFILMISAFIFYRYFTLQRHNKKLKGSLSIINQHVLLLHIDLNGYINNSSQAFCQRLGYKEKELLNKYYSRIYYHTQSKKKIEQMKVHLDKNNFHDNDVQVMSKFGDLFWFYIQINTTYSLTGKKQGYNIIFQDISSKKELERISQTDRLTNIPNRLFLDKQFEKEVKRAKRYQTVFSIIIVDIDHFKDFNDIFGHQTGDRVLIKIARTLAKVTRETDAIGRWGGEEFLIICPESDVLSDLLGA